VLKLEIGNRVVEVARVAEERDDDDGPAGGAGPEPDASDGQADGDSARAGTTRRRKKGSQLELIDD
jgi:hypothetical protein